MNNKRQTIWLVSMLSLMVILSAYYLFTEDSGPVNPPVADSQQVDGMKQGEAKETAGIMDPTEGLVINEVVNGGQVTDDAGAADWLVTRRVQRDRKQEYGENTGRRAGATEGESGKKSEATEEKARLRHLEQKVKLKATRPRRMRKYSKRWNSKIRQYRPAVNSRITSGSVRKATTASMRNWRRWRVI